jgi:hypothetical protein
MTNFAEGSLGPIRIRVTAQRDVTKRAVCFCFEVPEREVVCWDAVNDLRSKRLYGRVLKDFTSWFYGGVLETLLGRL